ncbi:MAG TPA: fibronectin type III domain-containing protein [Vicinamibacterales bacterium]|nr:fibronectin type III domain-containing protein [Vicinamibacterales bacterium]
MSTRSLLVAGLIALALARPQAQTQTQTAVLVADLADSSAVIATGRVSALSSAHDGIAIYTYVTLQVTEVLKGAVPDGPIVLKQIGGVAEGLALHIDGQARFSEGDAVLVFLSARPRDHTLYTVGLSQGAWRVTRNGSGGRYTAAQAGAALDMSELRTLVLPSTPARGQFVTTPPEMPSADLPARSANFTFLAGGPARWHQADDGLPIPVDYATVPGGLPVDGLDALDTAMGAWNAVGTTLRLDRGAEGNPTCPSSAFSGNGRIAFYWDDPCGEIGDGDAVTFGVGGGYFTPGSARTVNGVVFEQFLQGIAILNNTGPHLAKPACFQDAATHVLGHAIGLGDSADGTAVMFQTLRSSCNSGSSGPGSDDIAGLKAIYPAMPGGGQAPNAPTALTASVSLNTVVLSWTPATSGGVVLNYLIEAGSSPGLSNLAVLSVPGAPATVTLAGVPPGTYFVRVRARNGLGTSAVSPETVVNVGSCVVPGAPSGLSYSAVDQLVSIAWTPPATGGPLQGYLLSAGYGPGLANAAVAHLGPTPGFSAVAPPGNYFVRVQAVNSCGVGPASADLLVSVQSCTAAPSAPTNLRFTTTGSLVTLEWSAPASGLPSRYRLVVGSAPGGADLLIFDTNDNATTLTATAPNGRYFVKVQAVNPCGTSPFSNEVVVTVP